MAIARKLFVRMSSKFLHSKGHQYASENVIKIGGDFGAIFRKKPWAIAQGIFQKIDSFF